MLKTAESCGSKSALFCMQQSHKSHCDALHFTDSLPFSPFKGFLHRRSKVHPSFPLGRRGTLRPEQAQQMLISNTPFCWRRSWEPYKRVACRRTVFAASEEWWLHNNRERKTDVFFCFTVCQRGVCVPPASQQLTQRAVCPVSNRGH